ncbi:YxlC family protein [Bacillus sp. SL00103]
MKEDQFTERLKEELQQLDEQIEVKEPSEQAVMMLLKQAKEQEKRRFKQEVLAYVLISLTILTLFVSRHHPFAYHLHSSSSRECAALRRCRHQGISTY